MSGKKQASVLTEFIPFICTSAIWGQSCFLIHLASCTLPAPQQLGLGGAWGGATTSTGSHGSQLVLGALIHLWRPAIADGCFIPCLLIWQGHIFISQYVVHYQKKKLLCQGHCDEEAFQRLDLQPQPRPSVSPGKKCLERPVPCPPQWVAAPAGVSLVP